MSDIHITGEEIRNGFFLDWNLNFPPNALQIYFTIRALSNNNSTAEVTVVKLTQLTGLAYATVHKALSVMIEAGIIKATKKGGKPNGTRL